MNKIFNEDCITGIPLRVQEKSVDLIITDPPFGIGFGGKKANYNRTAGNVLEGYAEVKKENYRDFTLNWMQAAKQALKPSGSMYVFSGWNNLGDVLYGLDTLGFKTVNHIIWKYQFGLVTTRKYVTSHYHLLYVCLDDKKRKFFPYKRHSRLEKTGNGGSAHYKDKEDVWDIPRENWTGSVKTPTKLPAEVIRKILCYSSEPGDLIMDPFLGSGQVPVVSKEEGRLYTGFEVSAPIFDFAQERLTTGKYRL